MDVAYRNGIIQGDIPASLSDDGLLILTSDMNKKVGNSFMQTRLSWLVALNTRKLVICNDFTAI